MARPALWPPLLRLGHPQSTATTTSAPASTAASGAGVATISVAHNGTLGSILVAGPKGRTVYLFAADKGPSSTCSGACAEAWPPVTTTGNPKAAGGAVGANLGTITRSDGTKQVTYKGHPLYYYVGDPNGGDTSGQGINSFGAAWYVLSPEWERSEVGAYSSASRQISTETSSTLSGIGGSGLVAFTHTPSSA